MPLPRPGIFICQLFDSIQNEAMTENLSMYAHLGFVETHRAVEKGFHRVYLRLTLLPI